MVTGGWFWEQAREKEQIILSPKNYKHHTSCNRTILHISTSCCCHYCQYYQYYLEVLLWTPPPHFLLFWRNICPKLYMLGVSRIITPSHCSAASQSNKLLLKVGKCSRWCGHSPFTSTRLQRRKSKPSRPRSDHEPTYNAFIQLFNLEKLKMIAWLFMQHGCHLKTDK